MTRSQVLAFLHVFPYLAFASALHSDIVIRQSSQHPSPDPCGPAVQGQAGQPTNTCNGIGIPAAPVPAPAIYAGYLDSNEEAPNFPPQHEGDPNTPSPWARACKTSINYLCNKLRPGNTKTWLSNADGVSCGAMVWVPDPTTGAQLPKPDHCMNDILFPLLAMLDNLAPGLQVNRASVNIPLSGFPSGDNTGSQIDSGYASWILQ